MPAVAGVSDVAGIPAIAGVPAITQFSWHLLSYR